MQNGMPTLENSVAFSYISVILKKKAYRSRHRCRDRDMNVWIYKYIGVGRNKDTILTSGSLGWSIRKTTAQYPARSFSDTALISHRHQFDFSKIKGKSHWLHPIPSPFFFADFTPSLSPYFFKQGSHPLFSLMSSGWQSYKVLSWKRIPHCFHSSALLWNI